MELMVKSRKKQGECVKKDLQVLYEWICYEGIFRGRIYWLWMISDIKKDNFVRNYLFIFVIETLILSIVKDFQYIFSCNIFVLPNFHELLITNIVCVRKFAGYDLMFSCKVGEIVSVCIFSQQFVMWRSRKVEQWLAFCQAVFQSN